MSERELFGIERAVGPAEDWKARAEAAEARFAKVEKAAWPIWRALNLGVHVDLAQREALFAALSDTQEVYCGVCGTHIPLASEGICGMPPGCALSGTAQQETRPNHCPTCGSFPFPLNLDQELSGVETTDGRLDAEPRTYVNRRAIDMD